MRSKGTDLVISDILMPRMDGYELVRRLRASPATTLLPVILVTSADPQTERVKGIEVGADDFIAKPVNWAELFAPREAPAAREGAAGRDQARSTRSSRSACATRWRSSSACRA